MGESSGTRELASAVAKTTSETVSLSSSCSGFISSLAFSLSSTDNWPRLSFYQGFSSKRPFPLFSLSLQFIFPGCYCELPIGKFSMLPLPHKPITPSNASKYFYWEKMWATWHQTTKPSQSSAVLSCLNLSGRLNFFSYFNWKLFGRKENTHFSASSYFIEYPPNYDICHAWRSLTC